VDEAALYVANAPDPAAARIEATSTMQRLLDGIAR
jgi:hypothetical protein